MKKKITLAVLTIFIIMSVFPMSAFAKDKTVESIDITVKKPILNAVYSEEDKDYNPKIDENCGLELVNESWLLLEDDEQTGTPNFKEFKDGDTYFLLAFFKVKEGYKLPKDLSLISVNMSFTNVKAEKPKYVENSKYKYEDSTYTLDDDDPSQGEYLTFIYAVKIEEKSADIVASTVAQIQQDMTDQTQESAKADDKSPNTVAAVVTALVILVVVGTGVVIAKKRRK